MANERSGSDPHEDIKNKILRNIPGFKSQEKLDAFERAETAVALVALSVDPVKGKFDREHFQKIHQRIFEKVYPWAGELRNGPLQRYGSFPFESKSSLVQSLDATFTKLASEKHLKGLSEEAFSARAAALLGMLNSIHCYREGNGRTQREFIRELAAEAGHRINWNRVTSEQMHTASKQSHNLKDNTGLVALIRASIEPPKDFGKPTEPGRGTGRDRKELANEAHLLLRSTSGNIRDVPIREGNLQVGSIASGWALAKSQQHVAIATGANHFLLFHRSLLTKDVQLGQNVQIEMKKDKAVVRSLERSRGR